MAGEFGGVVEIHNILVEVEVVMHCYVKT